MRCIHCGSDTKYKDRRTINRCSACQHPFAFEPKTQMVGGVGIADGLFERVIKDVSGDGTVFFTEKQLWYEFNRRVWKKTIQLNGWGFLAGASGIGGVVGGIVMASVWPVA